MLEDKSPDASMSVKVTQTTRMVSRVLNEASRTLRRIGG